MEVGDDEMFLIVLAPRLRKSGFSETNPRPSPPADAGPVAPVGPRRLDLVAEISCKRRWYGTKTQETSRLFHHRRGPGAGNRGTELPDADGHEDNAPGGTAGLGVPVPLRGGPRLSQDPPIIFLRPEVTENKSKKGREVPIPADLVESLGDLASIHAKDRRKPLFDISRQWVSKSMKEAAIEAGLDPARAHPPRAAAHLRPERCAGGSAYAGAPAVAGTPFPGGDGTLRAAGRRPPRLGEEAVRRWTCPTKRRPSSSPT